MLTRVLLLIVLSVYLVGLGFLLPSINTILPSDEQKIDFGSNDYSVSHTDTSFTLVNSISDLPTWFNWLFIILPSIIWVLVLATLFFPTGNAGA